MMEAYLLMLAKVLPVAEVARQTSVSEDRIWNLIRLRVDAAWKEAIRALLLMLAPSAPHAAEELWERLGYAYSIHNQDWPVFDPALARAEEVPLIVQVNGKLRDRIMVAPDIAEAEAKRLALESPKTQPFLARKTVAQCIFVPGKLINLVVK